MNTDQPDSLQPPRRTPRHTAGEKLRDADKVALNPQPVIASDGEMLLRKPAWIRVRLPTGGNVQKVREVLRQHQLSTVCEEASCPNLAECFGNGTATFMIMGDICTRRCPFCDVAHGKPQPLNADEPRLLAAAIAGMQLRYVVITSVDRDDLRDGGAAHFTSCIRETRAHNPGITIEVLVPDFRGRLQTAVDILGAQPPDVFNHNIETVPRLYREARPGANYAESLRLLQAFGKQVPTVPTKSGLMLGLGETETEVLQVLDDLRAHGVSMLTIGQYLQPSLDHLPVREYIHPDQFDRLAEAARERGFASVASAPLVRSSYHADEQAALHRPTPSV